jgi:hypothetical protein
MEKVVRETKGSVRRKYIGLALLLTALHPHPLLALYSTAAAALATSVVMPWATDTSSANDDPDCQVFCLSIRTRPLLLS